MAVVYEIKERRVIPNWRDFKRTLQLGELAQSNLSFKPVELSIDRSVQDWTLNQNIGTAADLINSAFVSGKSNEQVESAITLLRENDDKLSPTLSSLIQGIEDQNRSSSVVATSLLEVDVASIEEFKSLIDTNLLNKIIRKTRNKAKNELLNPIVWVELARLYSMVGQQIKAERAILTALNLAPNNRFVLRCATRFFIHSENFEKAIYYLRTADSTKYDPWLVSAHIATSSIMGRYSPFIKDGRKLIDSGTHSNFEVTELASSLATLEFKNGSFKKAKNLFDLSLQDPNDNSLAQMEWISKDDGRFNIDPYDFNQVINPFEARALEQFNRGEWNESLSNTLKWVLDMPFSKRPILLGSYVAGSVLKDKQTSQMLCEVGLKANPNDPTLLNNMVYTLVTSGQIELSEKYINQMKNVNVDSLPNETRITFQATFGLVALNNGELEIGKQLYQVAIDNARRIGNKYLENLALANYVNALIDLGLHNESNHLDKIKQLKVDSRQKDLQVLVEDVLNKEKLKS